MDGGSGSGYRLGMDDKATLSELRERYFQDRRWKELADVLQREIPLTQDRAERLDLYEELGSVALDHLQDAAMAFDAFKTVIDLRTDWTDGDAADVYRQILEVEPGFAPAFERLDQALRRRGDLEALQELAARYIDLAAEQSDPGQFLQYQGEASRIFEIDLGDPDSALVVLIATLTVDTWQSGVLDEMERLARYTGEWNELIAKVQELIDEMTDGPSAGRLHKRVGFWLVDLGWLEDAAHHLRMALRHAAADRDIDHALGRIYRQMDRWEDLLEAVRRQRAEAVDSIHDRELRDQHVAILTEACENVLEPRAKAAFLAELGGLHDVEFSDRLTAVTLWEQALNLESETLAAARPLIDHYMAENRWETAAPVLESVVKAAEANRNLLEPAELNHRYLQYGELLDRLGNEKLALHAYRQAYEIDRNNPKTLERLGLLLYEADEFDQAYHALIQLADRHERTVSAEVMLEVLQKAADIKRRHGDARVAKGLLERALRIAPNDRATLRALADLGDEAGDFEQAMAARQRIVDGESDPKVKYAELVKIGDAWAEKSRHEQSAKAYVAALDHEPSSVVVFRKLLEQFRAMGRNRESVGVLERLADLEEDRIKRATLFYTMGIICRDELHAPQRAVGYFNRALDANPELLKAFEAIDRILTDEKQWKELERAYRRMLHRVTENELNLDLGRRNDLNFLLWTSLGEVYRSRLGQPEGAIPAFETAQAIRPDDDKVRMILAELYTMTGANTKGAIEQHRKLLEKDPMREDSYHALFQAYLANREFDRAWCIAGVLYFMQHADHEESEYYRKYLGWNLKIARAAFYPEILDKVYPREQNRVVNGIMAHLAVGLREHFANAVKDYGVHPKNDLIDPNSANMVIAKIYGYVGKTLGHTPPPLLYVRRDHPLGIRILNSDPPAILLGSDMLSDAEDDRDAAFRLGKLLAWMRPEHYLATIGNTPEQLTVIFVSAMDWALGRKPTAGKDGAMMLKHIKGMSSQTQLQLQSLLRVYVERTQQPPDMTQWVTAAEHATTRFGLILCNDLQKAVSGIKAEPAAMTTATLQQRVEKLVSYAASETYSDVRKELGLAIG